LIFLAKFKNNKTQNEIKNMKKVSFKLDFEFTPKQFWSIIPFININLSSKEIEIGWLCFGIYIGKVANKIGDNIELPKNVEDFLVEYMKL